MKLTTRVVLGCSLIIGVMVLTHFQHTYLVDQLSRANQELASTAFTARILSLESSRDFRELQEFTLKYAITKDEFYLSESALIEEQITDNLNDLLRLALSERALQHQTERVLETWTTCQDIRSQVMRLEDEVQVFEDCVEELTGHMDALVETNQALIGRSLREAEGIRQRVTTVSRTSIFIAVALSALISLLTYLSISRSIQKIDEGTQKIASGDFEARVDIPQKDELQRVAVSFNQMASRLQELDELKKNFISAISHDLRAPLASIQETTQLILDEMSEGLDETQKQLLELNLTSSRRLSKMIEDLLQLSRMQAGVMRYDLESVAIEGLVKQVLDHLHGLLAEKRLKVVNEIPPGLKIRADRSSWLQVLENLLSNAIGFSPEHGTITISAGVVETDHSDSVRLCFQDQGPGIPDCEKEAIFDRFYSTERGTRRRKSTGLGLTIARQVVSAHNGEIRVEDPEEGGSRFVILIPRDPSSSTEAA